MRRHDDRVVSAVRAAVSAAVRVLAALGDVVMSGDQVPGWTRAAGVRGGRSGRLVPGGP
ncbi:hypothetical protein [Streptomyces sp. ALI-76-A]|uniref:hypothetical protein n=1 Tax=Streptomyces sp. ALI-76-A TaxID=3025736 RepID=UPI00256ED77D|nr:hypothetical protein [Streptomyces sp. ALI-76-A]MDL5204306.1 hypothetical protein [Streptomyces sp. ALI-76-A]